jgi:rhodanese-related sulfurtransferase
VTLKFVQDNIWLILIALVSAVGLVWPSIARRFSGVPQVGGAEAVTLINRRDALVLDVREQSEHDRGRIPGARLIPAAQLKTRLGELERLKQRPIVVHCATGNRSQGAAVVLKGAGFPEVFNLQGGMGAWQQAGMPVEKP